MPIILTDENFEKEINSSVKPILVDFFATWCGPCSMLAPVLEKVEKDLEGKFILAKVNVDDCPLVSQKFAIDRIPAVFLFKNGKQADGFIGVKSEEDVKIWLKNTLAL